MSDWRPIETCPKDGKTPFLAYQPEGDMSKHEYWGEIIAVITFDGNYFQPEAVSGYEWESEIEHPTHWMPLPSPP